MNIRRFLIHLTLALVIAAILPAAAFAEGTPSWTQVNEDGFGEPNFQLPSFAVFNGYLYSGTWLYDWTIDQVRSQIWRSPDGTHWTKVHDYVANGSAMLIVFKDYIYSGSWDGTIVRSKNGLKWETVDAGFNFGIARFEVYRNALYASTWSDYGTQIWRTTNGTTWTQFGEDGFGDMGNTGAIASAVFGKWLYWGVMNWGTGAQIWRMNGTTSEAVVQDGFGSIDNASITALASFDDQLYAATFNFNGNEVWRSPNGTDWEKVAAIGNPSWTPAAALEEFRDQLYLVAGNLDYGVDVWRTANGTTWEQVASGGFGDINNMQPYWDNGTIVFKGTLYTGITNFWTGGEVWRLCLDECK